MGLGLTVARGFIEAVGGALGYRGHPGRRLHRGGAPTGERSRARGGGEQPPDEADEARPRRTRRTRRTRSRTRRPRCRRCLTRRRSREVQARRTRGTRPVVGRQTTGAAADACRSPSITDRRSAATTPDPAWLHHRSLIWSATSRSLSRPGPTSPPIPSASVDEETLAVYEDRGHEWAAGHRDPVHRAEAESFAEPSDAWHPPAGPRLRRRPLPPVPR